MIALVIGLLAGFGAVPGVPTQARDFPNWQMGGKADDFVDYFKENGIWYLVTLKPNGSRHGQVYAAGAMDGVKNVVIPAGFKHSSKDYDVLGVNDNAFNGDDTITSVEVKKGVKYIGEYAFNNCTNLTTVKLGDSVNEIGTVKTEDVNEPKAIYEVETDYQLLLAYMTGESSMPETIEEIKNAPDSVKAKMEKSVYSGIPTIINKCKKP